MTPDQARQLLGGLAAGILTAEERQTLFEAALHDQALFNEVADELEFSAFLQSPETRAQLANRIEVEPERREWWASRPAWLALSGVLAASIVLFVAIRQRPGEVPHLSAPAPPAPALTAPPVTESEKKQPAQALSKAPFGPKLASVARSMPGAKSKPVALEAEAAKEEIRQNPVAQNRPEPRDQRAAERMAPAPRPAIAGSLVAPQAAPPPPPAAIDLAQPAVRQRAFAESSAASLSGTVHDPTGMAVPGAKVDIVNTATNTTIHAATDSSGRFVALSLPQGGPYTVTANAPGFTTARRSVTLEANQPAQIDIPLNVGPMSESVNITAGMPLLTTSQNLTQVAVLDFANGNQQNRSGAQVADQLSSQLLNSGQLGVIDREKVQQAVQSQNSTGRPPNAQEAAAVGRIVGADAVIVGSVQNPAVKDGSPAGIGGFAKKAPSNVSVQAEIIDTKQARPAVTVSADAASLQGATNLLGDKIQSQLTRPVEGKVTRRTGDIVSIAFVEPSGLHPGARCDVIRGTRKIGELVITSVNGLSAFGKFTGATPPRSGDRVTSSR